MKKVSDIQHEALCSRLASFLSGQGLTVEREVALPSGKGVLDLYASSPTVRSRIFEVKSSPASLSQGKVVRQINLYRELFSQAEVYLASPSHDQRNIIVLNSTNSERTQIPYN